MRLQQIEVCEEGSQKRSNERNPFVGSLFESLFKGPNVGDLKIV